MSETLGTFGEAVAEIDIDFVYFGERIRINPDFCQLDLIDFAERGEQVDESSAKAMVMVKDFFKLVIAEDDFDAWWKAARKNRQTVPQLMELVQKIVEKISARPTGPQSDSSAGLRETETSSTDISYDKVLSKLDGRPDLQLAVVDARAARAGLEPATN